MAARILGVAAPPGAVPGSTGAASKSVTGRPRKLKLTRRRSLMGIYSCQTAASPSESDGVSRHRDTPATMALNRVIKGNGEQRRPRADERLAPPTGIEPEIGLGDDVLPAVLVELVDRCSLLALLTSLPGR